MNGVGLSYAIVLFILGFCTGYYFVVARILAKRIVSLTDQLQGADQVIEFLFKEQDKTEVVEDSVE